MKKYIKKIPVVGNWCRRLYWKISENTKGPKQFPGSQKFWENKYTYGGNSGEGSYGQFAEFKAEVLNKFVSELDVKRIIEFGCGDGNQLGLASYPEYVGFDVSETAVSLCKEKFASDPTKTFKLMKDYADEVGDLSLSLDVIFHLVEHEVFEKYMRVLFKGSQKYIIIYSSNSNKNRGNQNTQTWHRKFTKWIKKNRSDWKLIVHIPNRYPYKGDYRKGSFSDFYFYQKA